MRISLHGNERGYTLIDAMVSLFIASIAVVAMLGTLAFCARLMAKQIADTDSQMEKRNTVAEGYIGTNELQ